MAGKTPVKQADNLPSTPKPTINRPTPTTIKVPQPPYTPTPGKKAK